MAANRAHRAATTMRCARTGLPSATNVTSAIVPDVSTIHTCTYAIVSVPVPLDTRTQTQKQT
jgi:hypothetical protein